MFNEEKGQPAQIMFSGISVTSGETTQCKHDDLNFKNFQTNCTDPSRVGVACYDKRGYISTVSNYLVC